MKRKLNNKSGIPFSLQNILLISLLSTAIFCVNGCKTKDYDWENFSYAAAPKVIMNVERSALPTVATANVSFFNISEPDFASNQFFEWQLDYYDAEGRAEVASIEVYVSFNKRESTPPQYPIVLSLAGVFPTERQFPLPSTLSDKDKLYETVSEFPKSYRFTPAELAAITETDLNEIAVNDYFLFKFVINQRDGQRIVQYNDNSCDESRGELCDCRIGARFKSQ